MTLAEMHVKWSVILADRLGIEIFAILEIKGKVLHHLHLKVPGWLSDLNALLTRKLPMFFSRLNEISVGRRNRFSFGIIAENFEVFGNDIFEYKALWVGSVRVYGILFWFLRFVTCGFSVDFLGVIFACGYGVAMFFRKLAHSLAFVVKVGVVTTKEVGGLGS